MRNARLPVLALLLGPVALHAALPSQYARQGPAPVVPGEVLVRFKQASAGALQAAAQGSSHMAGDETAAVTLKTRLGLTRSETLLSGSIERLNLPGYLRVEDAVAQLKADPSVLWAQPNYLKQKHEAIPNDPMFTLQWPLKNTGQTGSDGAGIAGADMALTYAWDTRTDASAIKLAVVDDGFELTHEDLAANFIPGHNFNKDGSESSDPGPQSSSDTHGTMVAGAAGAVGNNGIGIAAPAWKVQLLPLRFGYDTTSEIKAFDYARAQGAKVVNASFGGAIFDQAEHDSVQALRDADILLVTSAGNYDSNTDFAKAAYPANYDLGNVVAVAATDRRDNLASFSQYGPVSVDVAAPGVRILTTAVGNTYQTISGTSFSSPYTAAVAALIRATYPTADYREVKARLIEGAARGNGISSIKSFTTGGRVDANASLNLAARPSLAIQSVSFDDSATGDNDGALDPGESLMAVVTFENLWATATNVSVSLQSGSGNVTATGAAQTIASIAKGATATLRFPITVASSAKQHEVVDFKLLITAAGGYSAERHFNAELGRLDNAVITSASFANSSQRDEFQTWQIDLPSLAFGYSKLAVTSTAGSDIDIIVKHGAPPEYEISLGVDPEGGGQTFFTDVPASQIGGGPTGNESVAIDNPAAGTWFVTVVNYKQGSNVPYTLSYNAQAASVGGSATSSGSGGSSGGGGGGGAFIAFPLLAALARRKRPC